MANMIDLDLKAAQKFINGGVAAIISRLRRFIARSLRALPLAFFAIDIDTFCESTGFDFVFN